MIFKPAARYPADPRAVFILALSVFSGLTSLALKVAPQSLEALLPHWGLITWGLTLTLGSAVTLTGMAFQSINGIVTEQVGSVMVGSATVFYAALALLVVGPSSLQNVGIVGAWGLACFIRWVQLQILVHNAILRKEKVDYLQRLFADLDEHDRRRLVREHIEADDLARHDRQTLTRNHLRGLIVRRNQDAADRDDVDRLTILRAHQEAADIDAVDQKISDEKP